MEDIIPPFSSQVDDSIIYCLPGPLLQPDRESEGLLLYAHNRLLTHDEAEEIVRAILRAYSFYSREEIEQAVQESIAAQRREQEELYRPRQHSEKKRKTKKGWIYLLKAGEYYKIGCTTDMKGRTKQFGLSLPYAFDLLHTIPSQDIKADEKALHSLFAERRGNGEWFTLSDEDVAYICSLEEL